MKRVGVYLCFVAATAATTVGCGDSGGEGGNGGEGGSSSTETTGKTTSASGTGTTGTASSSSGSTSSSSTSTSTSTASSSSGSTSSSTSSTSSSTASSSSTSTSTSSGSSSSSSGSSVSATGSTSSASGSTGSGMLACDTGVLANLSSTTCSDCIDCTLASTCATEVAAYQSDPDAVDFNDCINLCQTQACFDGCAASYPTAAAAYDALVTCVICDECPNNCDASTNCFGNPPAACDTGMPGSIQSALCSDCITCTQTGNCATEWDTFDNHPETPGLISCLNPCLTTTCQDQCFAAWPGATDAYIDAVSCSVCVECVDNCDAATNCGP